MEQDKKFMTIRQTAATGILPEYRLRMLEKQGKLPGFYAGKTFRVNIEMLIQYLDELSKCEEAD